MEIRVILVEPSKPENIGAVARLMKNFGFSKLYIVNPVPSVTAKEALIVARKGTELLTNAVTTTSFAEAIKGINTVIGTTARLATPKNIIRNYITLPELIQNYKLTELGAIGLVFGRESHGLYNEEIKQCDLLVTIPTYHEYPTLNLSHAVAIVLYSIYQKISQEESIKNNHTTLRQETLPLATADDKKAFFSYFDKLVDISGYREVKRNIIKQNFRNIVHRAQLRGRESSVLIGFFKWLIKRLEESE